MKMIFGFLGALVLVVAIGVGWVGYQRHVDDKIHTELLKAKTIRTLGHIGGGVRYVGLATELRPPTDNAALVTWLDNNGVSADDGDDSVIVKDGRFVDGWGNDIHVTMISADVMQLGSAGENEQWEGGAGDDMMSARIHLSRTTAEP